MCWGPGENEELGKKETGHVTVAKVEILGVSFNTLFVFSAVATQMVFPVLLSPRDPSAGWERGHKGVSVAQLLSKTLN